MIRSLSDEETGEGGSIQRTEYQWASHNDAQGIRETDLVVREAPVRGRTGGGRWWAGHHMKKSPLHPDERLEIILRSMGTPWGVTLGLT